MADANAPCNIVPLNKLILSSRNVRKTNGDEDIESLADSIAAKGLLQNLVVSEAQSGRGLYEVDAGGRRYRALQLLVARKTIPRNFPVPVLVVPREDATEASLAENLQKIAMNLADEVEAFAAIVDRYAERGSEDPVPPTHAELVAHCARRFGVTSRHVEQRLRLAALAPEILDALRKGRMTLDAAKAYASAPDQETALKIFHAEDKRESYGHSPQAIRNQLAGKTYPATHPRVRFVGLEAYVEAGGRLEPDLFFGKEDDSDLLIDTQLVDRLFTDKASIEAGKLALANGWADGMVKAGQYTYDLPKPPEGHAPRHYGALAIPKEERGESIALYMLNGDGELQAVDQCFVPAKPRDETPEVHAPSRNYLAEQRAQDVREIAARMAVPSLAGTPLEERAFWPPDLNDWMSSFGEDENDDTSVIVTLMVRVPKADVEANLAEAEVAYERRREEEAAVEAVKQLAETIGEIVEGYTPAEDAPPALPTESELEAAGERHAVFIGAFTTEAAAEQDAVRFRASENQPVTVRQVGEQWNVYLWHPKPKAKKAKAAPAAAAQREPEPAL